MKIGIITFHFALNYGAALQTYALQKVLFEMGHVPKIIDYRPAYLTDSYKWSWRCGSFNFKNLILPTLNKKFNKFCNSYMQFTPLSYRTLEELRENPPEADAYICGSDQIWNSDLTGYDSAYFLKFGKEHTKRISYAASLGKDRLKELDENQIKSYLKDFDFVSVREKSGVQLVSNNTTNAVDLVLDPTLLVTDYKPLLKKRIYEQKKYVLVINLQNNPLLNQTAELVSNELKLPIINLNNYSAKFWKFKGTRMFPSPEKYLELIKLSEYVITNSFHGTIFSIIFNKRFLTTSLSGKNYQRNCRMTDLLNSLGLSDHFIEGYSISQIKELLSKETDWLSVCNLLKIHQKSSFSFLENALRE